MRSRHSAIRINHLLMWIYGFVMGNPIKGYLPLIEPKSPTATLKPFEDVPKEVEQYKLKILP